MEKVKEVKLCNLTKEDFLFLESFLLAWGFRRIRKQDKRRTFRRLGLSAPRPINGSEVGFEYYNNGYSVIIWMSYVEEEEKWRDVGEDAAWVLIRKGDIAKYFAKPLQRRPSMIMKLLRYAWVSKWKIDNPPLCYHKSCGAQMEIGKRYDRRGYYWFCDKVHQHEDGRKVTVSWDVNLGPKAKEFVEIRRKLTREYKERVKKSGKKVTPAAKIRKPWPIGKPGNLEK